MSALKNRKGQAMVESAGAMFLLFIIFVSVYYLFLMSIEKIRSLETSFRLARAQQVQSLSRWPLIEQMCFGRMTLGTPPVTSRRVAGLGIDEVDFRFLPHTLRTIPRPWESF